MAGGNPDSWYLGYNFNLYYKYSNGIWTSCVTKQCGLDTASDIVAIASNPVTNKLYLGSFGRGLYEINEATQEVKAYNETNSSLGCPPSDINRPLNISGLKVDPNGNLPVSNYGLASPLSVFTTDGKSEKFHFPRSIGKMKIHSPILMLTTTAINGWRQYARLGYWCLTITEQLKRLRMTDTACLNKVPETEDCQATMWCVPPKTVTEKFG